MIAVPPAPVIDAATAARVRLVCFDVDGVLTDGGIVLGDAAGARVELKRYDIQDGLGIVALRAAELGVDELVQDRHARKVPALQRLLDKHGVDWAEVAFVGDDLPDLGVMRRVGLSASVANAAAEARRASAVHLTKRGGAGAVREFCELLLRARGDWDAQVEAYVASRSGDA
jgi:3-deoxy-D-manno-octulosonate 8-phosphate phosphatase (KDO 8-P phosphatase)